MYACDSYQNGKLLLSEYPDSLVGEVLTVIGCFMCMSQEHGGYSVDNIGVNSAKVHLVVTTCIYITSPGATD